MRVSILIVFLALFGCGRYTLIMPPEALSPKAVSELTATADANGVLISWSSPESDLRGQPLKYIDSYKIYRKILSSPKPDGVSQKSDTGLSPGSASDPIERTVDRFGFELVSTIEDHHLIDLARRRAEAKAQGRISRRVKPEPSSTKFSFLDKLVSPGVTYVYRVVPINQGDLEGRVAHVVRVKFEQTNSTIALVDSSKYNANLEGDDEEFSSDL